MSVLKIVKVGLILAAVVGSLLFIERVARPWLHERQDAYDKKRQHRCIQPDAAQPDSTPAWGGVGNLYEPYGFEEVGE